MEIKSFTPPHCIHCKPQDILRSHGLKEKEISEPPTMCKMERKVRELVETYFIPKTLANALFKPSFLCTFPPM
jgi:hypothetical protein